MYSKLKIQNSKVKAQNSGRKTQNLRFEIQEELL
jgi:hypothetical protein